MIDVIPPARVDDLAQTAAVLKALGDPNRLRIFTRLMHGDSCNCELVAELGMPANLLSHHLRVLAGAGLIDARRDRVDGRWIYYSINRAAIAGWQSYLTTFLDPARIGERSLCGPEGRC